MRVAATANRGKEDRVSKVARRAPPRRPRRVARRALVGVAIVVVAVVVAVVVYARLHLTPPSLVGGAIPSQASPAPNLTLTDQFEHPQSLRAFRGRPIAMTFLYTHCPDVCPLIAGKLHAAVQKLGADAQRTTLIAVTVDPERDTIPQIREYSQQHGLMNEWFFLTGTRPQLEAVWKAYGITAQTVAANGAPITPIAVVSDQSSPASIEHAAPVFLIDKRGNVRALLPTDFQIDDLVLDFKLLLDEP